MPSNELHHNKTLSNLNAEVKYANFVRRWSRFGRNGEASGASGFRSIRKAYNKAHRKASKLQLSRYHVSVPTQREEDEEYYRWEDERYMEDMGWTLSRDEKAFNDEVRRGLHLDLDQQWLDWNKAYDKTPGV